MHAGKITNILKHHHLIVHITQVYFKKGVGEVGGVSVGHVAVENGRPLVVNKEGIWENQKNTTKKHVSTMER